MKTEIIRLKCQSSCCVVMLIFNLNEIKQFTIVLVLTEMLCLQVIRKQTLNIKLVNKKKYCGTMELLFFVSFLLFQNCSLSLLQKFGLSSNGKRNIRRA